jgi:hypothetical protein
VALYINSYLKPKRVSEGIAENLELVAAKFNLNRSMCLIVSMYRPPNCHVTTFIENLTNFISIHRAKKDHTLIMVGDTNLCALQNEFSPLQTINTTFKMKQVIDEPTHLRRLIDQIFVPTDTVIISSGLNAPIEKTHAQTWVRINLLSPLHKVYELRKATWKFKNVNWKSINQHMMKTNLLCKIETARTADEAVTEWNTAVKEIMEKYIPRTKSDRKPRATKQWIGSNIVRLHRKKTKAYRKWKSTKENSHQANYRQLTRKLKQEILLTKTKEFNDVFRGCKDSATFWSALNTLSGRKQTKAIPVLVLADSKEANDDFEKAEALLKQFSSVFNKTDTPIQENNPLIEDTNLYSTSVKSMLNNIKNLPIKKASGVDNIPPTFIKKCSLVVAPCLTVIANRCLNEGTFPTAWKEAIIKPVPKVMGSSQCSDYRPISLLPTASKLVERQIYDILCSQIEPKLSNSQYGFRQGRSTTEAILLLQHHVLKGFELCERSNCQTLVCATFYDVAKAFDTVPIGKLINSMSTNYNLPTTQMALLKSYLTDRSMKVSVGDQNSSSSAVISGVAQGSVIGPLLFIAYINAIANAPTSPDSDIILYADDLVHVKPLTCPESHAELQNDVNEIVAAFDNLGLKLNEKKCKYVLFSLSPTHSSARGETTDIRIKGEPMERVPSYRYLGVQFDERLAFAEQTELATTKTKKGIGALARTLRKWAPREILCKAISEIAIPCLLYGIEVWYPSDDTRQQRIERTQKYAARLITNNFKAEANYDELIKQLGWKSIQCQVMEKRLINLYKYKHCLRYIPEEVFPKEVPTNNRRSNRLAQTRHSNCLQLPTKQKNAKEIKLVVAQSILAWNALTEDIIKKDLKGFVNGIKSTEIFEKMCAMGVINKINV